MTVASLRVTMQASCTKDWLHVVCSHDTESLLNSTEKLAINWVLDAFHLRSTL